MKPVKLTLTDAGDPVSLAGAAVSSTLFGVLGIRPELGRLFTDADDRPGAPASTVLISHALWRSRFGADPGVIGRVVRLDGQPRTIAGVLPSDTAFPSGDVWVPLAALGVRRSHRQVARRRRPARAWTFHRPGTCGDLRGRREFRAHVSRSPRLECADRTALRLADRSGLATDGLGPARRRRVAHGAELLEHREPARDARGRPPRGDGRARRAGRRASAPGAPVDDREPAARGDWRPPRRARRVLDARRAVGAPREPAAARSRRARRWPCARVQRRGGRGVGDRFRADAVAVRRRRRISRQR